MKRLALVLMLMLTITGPGTTSALADFILGGSLTDTTAEDGGFDADDNGWKIFFGYRPARFFGVEGQYVDFGEFQDSVGGSDVRREITSLDVYAVGGFKIWKFDLFGKAGFASWDSEVTLGPGSDDSGTDFAWGIGAAFRIGERLWVRAEREVYEIDDVDLEMTSLGAAFRF